MRGRVLLAGVALCLLAAVPGADAYGKHVVLKSGERFVAGARKRK